MGSENDVIKVAVCAAKKIIIHANGSPARILGVGLAAGATFVGTGIGYGLYKGGDKLIGLLKPKLIK